MSRIKFILFWLGAFCITNLSFGQQATMPAQCTNPGNGFKVGGDFTRDVEFGCLDFTKNSAVVTVSNPQAPNGATLVGANYIFNLRDGRDITGNYSTRLDTTVTTPGIYWIMQSANVGGEVFVSCKSFEIIKTEQPDVSVSSCGTNSMTVNFLNTNKNKAHGGYRIVWGDGSQDFIPSITAASFPFSQSHPYATPPTSLPQIVAVYTRGTGGSIEACRSTPYPFEFETNNKPRINELEGLTGGTSNKLTMVEGTDGKDYTLEQKPKTGNWADTGKKITRNTGEAFKTETITGLNAANEYCFRLKTIDGCGNSIISNEVCTIIPKATVISSKEVKLDWTSPDPAVVRYSIGYKESPTGLNPNNAAPVTPTATTYTFDALDCKKQYDFQVTAHIGSTPTDRVLIKSPMILVNPATTPLLNAKTIATVSVQNENLIKFNIFEPDGLEKNYTFYRSEGGSSNFVKVKESSQNFYEDQNVEPNRQQYCYKVEYQDECDNVSQQSPAFCSVYLTSTRPNTLNWTQFVIPSPNTFPVLYYVEAIDETGFPIQADATPDNTLGVKAQIDRLLDAPSAQGKAYFRINAVQKVEIIEKNGTKYDFPFTVYSNIYTFITPAQLYIPTAFSPNGDDKNDTFTAKGRYIVEFNLEVYDRWGNVIFESRDLDTGWNGTASDGTTPAPAGNYGFKVYGLDPAGQKFEKVGSVTLIR
ncbi:MAG: gliding motility-associated C-terminal domain-containing protein [Emticicia sp.]|nr:gliding motility-associated C-terminal domain-containing protein [Emticicia sp.]